MAMLKYGHAAVTTPIVDPFKWVDKKVAKSRVVVAKEVIAKFDPSKWLLTHCSIMASIDADLANPKDKKSNYLIKPEYSIFVNNNGDCWERELLRKASKSFLGADNFIEHVQIPVLSKGKVIDVALREVPFTKDSDGKDLTTLYVDVLIATDRKHTDVINKISSGEYSALSMGCLIKYSYCSQCGKKAADESEACPHVRFYKNNFFFDKGGVKRVIAEICGDVDDLDSCKFVDASWVRKPAFEGAVLRNIVNTPTEDVSEKADKILVMPSFEKKPGMFLKAASKAAEEVVQELLSQDEPPAPPAGEPKAAPDTAPDTAPAAAPEDDIGFPEATPANDTPLETDTPATEEAPADMPPAEAPAPDGMGAPPTTPTPQIDEPKSDATVQELKDMVKKQLLNQMRRELLKEQASEAGSTRPDTSEISTNSSLIKDASSMQKILKEAHKLSSSKLLNGILILSNINMWSQFKKYGYGRNDVLAIMAFVDKTLSNSPVSPEAVRALSSMKTSSEDLSTLFTNIIVETGKKPGKAESMKLASWSKILRYFE